MPYSQFDYATIGGQPILFPNSQDGALQNVTFTWDLLKIVRPASAKTAALAALEALNTLQKTQARLKAKLAVETSGPINLVTGHYVALILAATSADDSRNWSRTKDSEWQIEGLHITSEGVLLGQPRCPSTTKAPCSGNVFVTVKDSVGQRADATIRLNLRQ